MYEMDQEDLVTLYHQGYEFLISQGFSDWEAKCIASMRIAFIALPEAFM